MGLDTVLPLDATASYPPGSFGQQPYMFRSSSRKTEPEVDAGESANWNDLLTGLLQEDSAIAGGPTQVTMTMVSTVVTQATFTMSNSGMPTSVTSLASTQFSQPSSSYNRVDSVGSDPGTQDTVTVSALPAGVQQGSRFALLSDVTDDDDVDMVHAVNGQREQFDPQLEQFRRLQSQLEEKQRQEEEERRRREEELEQKRKRQEEEERRKEERRRREEEEKRKRQIQREEKRLKEEERLREQQRKQQEQRRLQEEQRRQQQERQKEPQTHSQSSRQQQSHPSSAQFGRFQDQPPPTRREPSRPDRAAAKSKEATRLLDEGKLDAALELFSECIALQPTDKIGYYNRAGCLIRLGRYKEALEDGIKSTELNLDYAKVSVTYQ